MEYSNRRGMSAPGFFLSLAMLIVITFGAYYYADKHSANTKRKVTIQRLLTIEEALGRYLLDCGGKLPTSEQTLKILVEKPEQGTPAGWRGPYLSDESVLKDGWGRAFMYYCPGGPVEPGKFAQRPYDLYSYGSDGAEGGKGLERDISSADRASLMP